MYLKQFREESISLRNLLFYKAASVYFLSLHHVARIEMDTLCPSVSDIYVVAIWIIKFWNSVQMSRQQWWRTVLSQKLKIVIYIDQCEILAG